MAYDGIGIVLVLVQKVVYARECNLVYVFLYFLGCHAYTAVADGQGAILLVNANLYGEVAKLAFEVALSSKRFQLLGGINCIGYHLAKENLVV